MHNLNEQTPSSCYSHWGKCTHKQLCCSSYAYAAGGQHKRGKCVRSFYALYFMPGKNRFQEASNLEPRVFVPNCAGLTKRATLESSATRSILIGLKDNRNGRK